MTYPSYPVNEYAGLYEEPESRHLSPESDAPEPDDQQDDELPPFIVYHDGDRYDQGLDMLAIWVHELLVPIYGREIGSGTLWCPTWWKHAEAVAQLHGLWLAWQEYTGRNANLSGPAIWHRDFLAPTMSALRDSDGPFAGCKPGVHRPQDPLPVAAYPD